MLRALGVLVGVLAVLFIWICCAIGLAREGLLGLVVALVVGALVVGAVQQVRENRNRAIRRANLARRQRQ
jgi:high-affinity Fe2+/Pb2+ permease